MAATRLFSQLRRRSPSLLSSATRFPHCRAPPPPSVSSTPPPPPPIPSRNPFLHPPPTPRWHPCSSLYLSRSFFSDSSSSSSSSSPSSTTDDPGFRNQLPDAESVVESQPLDLGVINGGFEAVGADDLIFPVRAIISWLDGFHDLTGLPWWLVIVSCTLLLRAVLFPIFVLQLRKLKKIFELLPKLPSPFPPPLSGKSYMEQFSLFRKEGKAVGCPSPLWFIAYFSIQVPCFFLWVMSIRKMSLNHHPGFDIGGILWFQNLTEYPHGFSGIIFPTLIAGLYYTNVQLSFRKISVRKVDGLLGLLRKYYKMYLDLMTVPTFFIGFCVPQGSLVYWTTNATLTVFQQLFLNNPLVRVKLGLPDVVHSTEEAEDNISTSPAKSKGFIAVENLSPQELLSLSVIQLAERRQDRAIPLLQLAIKKDPEYIRALIVLGETLLQKGLLTDANDYLERAIAKLNLVNHPMEVEELDLLILASQWAGVACIRQGKKAEGIVHLERVAALKEPDDSASKAHYFDGLLLLASALYDDNRKDEAAKYLRLVVSYNPSYREFLEECENDDKPFDNDLVSSRRSDY